MANTPPIRKGEIEVKLTIRGTAVGVVNALANGLPLEALKGIRDGMTEELAKRQRTPARGRARRRMTITVTNKRKGSRS